MAIIYSEQDKYLRKNIFTGKVYALYWITALIVVLLGSWKFLLNRELSIAAAIYFLIFFIIPVAGLLFLFKRSDRKVVRYQSGQRGQRNTVNLLRLHLPDSYSVFAGLQLPFMRGDVDVVVVGPNGIFSIEVKNIRGVVSISDDKLLIDKRAVVYKNFVNQTFANARAISRFLESRFKKKLPVIPVLVFSHPQSYVNVGYRPFKGVHITHLSSLAKFIRRYEGQSVSDTFTIQLELTKVVGEEVIIN